MSKWTDIFFSKEHTGRSSKEKEVDTYRRNSDSSKVEKIAHNSIPTEKVDIKTDIGGKK